MESGLKGKENFMTPSYLQNFVALAMQSTIPTAIHNTPCKQLGVTKCFSHVNFPICDHKVSPVWYV